MKKILSLCINLVIFIISDAFAVKLIAGDHSVVKKDGATHTISKYYVVPNDFDPNNVTNSNITEASQITKLPLNHSIYSTSLRSGIKNEGQLSGAKMANKHNTKSNTTASSQITKLRLNHSIYSKSMVSRIKNEDQVSGVKLSNKYNTNSNTTEASQIKKLRLNHSIYSKSLGSGIKNEDQVSGVKLENKENKNNSIAIKNIEVSDCLDQNDVQDKVSNQTCDKNSEATESVTTEHITNPDVSFNLLVEPITYHINKSSNATADLYKTSNVLHNESRRIVQIATETDFNEELDDLILSNFGLEVHESSTKNIDSFWKLVKLNMDSTIGNKEFMAKLDRLTLLLNIFTYLYEAGKSQKPYESMIDGIIDILQIPYVEKINTFESQSDEECFIKCSRNRSKAQVDSKGTEPGGQKPSNNNLELKNLLLQSRTGDSDNEYALINPNNYQNSNEVIDSTEPTNSHLLKPYNLNIRKPDGNNVRSSKSRPKLNQVARDNDNIQGDPKSNQTFPDMTETDNYLDDQPSTTESEVTEPWIIEDKSTESGVTDDQPLTTASRVTKPWITENKPTANRVTKPWISEDKSSESRSSDDQPPTTKSGVTKPWIIEDKPTATRVTKPRIIEDKPTPNRVTKPWISEDKSSESSESRSSDDQPPTTESRITKPWIIQDKPTENSVTKPWIIEDNSTEFTATDDQPWTTESRVNKPWIIKDKSPKNLPSTMKTLRMDNHNLPWDSEDTTTKNLPWHIEYKTTENLPWHIVNKSNNRLPWIEHRTTTLPWIIEDRKQLPSIIEDRKQLPWIIEDRTQLPLIIEDRKQLPWTIEDRKQLPWIIEDRNQLPWMIEDRKQLPWTIEHRKHPSLVHSVKNVVEKPYHIYTYVINPTTSEHEIPNSGKIVDVKSRQPNSNHVTKSFSQYTSHGGSKAGYTDSPSYYTLQDILPKTTIDSKPSNSQLRHPKYVTTTYDTRNIVKPATQISENPYDAKPTLLQPTNQPGTSQLKLVTPTYDSGNDPSDLLYDTPQDDFQPKYALASGIETNNKPELLQPSEPHTNSGEDNDKPQVLQEESSQPGFPNDISYPFQNLQISDKFGLLSTASASVDKSGENPDFMNTKPKSNKPNINVNLIEATNVRPASVPKASTYSEYNLPNDYDELNYGGQTNKQPSWISTASSSTTYTNSRNDDDNPNYIRPENQRPGFISSSASSSAGYPNRGDYYDQSSPVYDVNTPQHPGYISKASSHSEFTTPNNYTNPTADSSEDIYQQLGYIPMVPYHLEYTNVPDNYDEQIPVYGDHTDQHATPVYGADLQQHPGYISKATIHSEYTNVPNDYNSPTADNSGDINQHLDFIPMDPYYPGYADIAENYKKPDPVNVEDINQQPGSVPKVPHYTEYTNVIDHYDKMPIFSGNTLQRPGYISKISAHSEYTNEPNNYHYPTAVNGEDTDQRPGSVPNVYQYPEYKKVVDKPNPIYSENTPQRPGYISAASLFIPNDYNNPTADTSEDREPGFIPEVSHHPEYISLHEGYNEPTPIYGANVPQRPHPSGHISIASAHSEYINILNSYTNDDKDTDRPSLTQNIPQYPVADSLNYNVDPTLFNNRPIVNKDIFPLAYNPHGQHTIQSSLIENIVSKPTEYNHIEQFKIKMAPTYRLFTLDNLLKLNDAVSKAIKISGADVSDSRALVNLRKIIKIILILAEHLEKPEGNNEWYIKIFHNAQTHRHPLQLYVYYLLRQRWLHELILLLDKNNFDIQIFQNPKIFSFLSSWQFPDDVQNFLKAEDLIHHDFDAPVDYATMLTSQKHKFLTHTYDDLLDSPENLASYVTTKVMQNYEAPNNGIVLSIAGVKAEPDANAIINILHKYLHYKSEIENQENVIIRDNKVEMLKQIILFLKQKGYNASTIANLIRKLYSAIYLSEEKDCQPHHPKFEKNIFDVILPVLRRSGGKYS